MSFLWHYLTNIGARHIDSTQCQKKDRNGLVSYRPLIDHAKKYPWITVHVPLYEVALAGLAERAQEIADMQAAKMRIIELRVVLDRRAGITSADLQTLWDLTDRPGAIINIAENRLYHGDKVFSTIEQILDPALSIQLPEALDAAQVLHEKIDAWANHTVPHTDEQIAEILAMCK